MYNAGLSRFPLSSGLTNRGMARLLCREKIIKMIRKTWGRGASILLVTMPMIDEVACLLSLLISFHILNVCCLERRRRK